jgi:hypothetical protein
MRMRAVSSLTGLTSIDLSGCSMTNDGLRELSSLTQLTSLNRIYGL